MRYADAQVDLACRVGERRTVRKFLLLPRRYANSKHSRWLEYADIVEEVSSKRVVQVTTMVTYVQYYWKEIGFADEMGEKQ